MAPRPPCQGLQRWFLLVAGWLCVLLGLVGILLPLLPTTPFLLLAAACFARSSQRFHRALLENWLCGPMIRDWQCYRAMRPQVKRRALLITGITFTVSILIVPKPAVQLLLLLIAACLLFYLWRLPVLPESSVRDTCDG